MRIDWRLIGKVFGTIFLILLIVMLTILVYFLGYKQGYYYALNKAEGEYSEIFDYLINEKTKVSSTVADTSVPTPPPEIVYVTPQPRTVINWSGPDLWAAVNTRRVERGVGQLSQRDELCTIASIRLNELLVLGQLDGHEGFGSLPDRREDLKWIFEKYDVSEFLVQGATSATEAVDLWENTLGHKKLLTGGEYVYGCTYAQEGFGVAIAAF